MPRLQIGSSELSKHSACIVVEEPVVGMFPEEIRLSLSPHAAEFIQLSHLEFWKEATVALKFCSVVETVKPVLNWFSFTSHLQSEDIKLSRGNSVNISPFYTQYIGQIRNKYLKIFMKLKVLFKLIHGWHILLFPVSAEWIIISVFFRFFFFAFMYPKFRILYNIQKFLV